MIKNERQYRITKSEADRFQLALAAWDPTSPPGVDPVIHLAQKRALESQFQELRRDVEEYEALRSGGRTVLEVESFEDFPSALVKARIAAGLSQKDLADRLGLKEQQVQRYEATDYASASLTRMSEVVKALGLKVRKDVFLPASDDSRGVLLRRLAEVGFDRRFVERRLSPDRPTDGEGTCGAFFQTATFASRVLGVTPSALLGSAPLGDARGFMPVTRFKVPERANEKRLSAYTLYAHYLALLLLDATAHLPRRPVPTDAAQVRAGILAAYGRIDLDSSLRFIWDHGVPVLPLDDPGAFHGACWRVGGRNVIALKQKTPSVARWLHDGLHEFRHAGECPEEPEFTVLEEDEGSMDAARDVNEKRANRFAGSVALDGRADDLAQKCSEAASGDIRRLKRVVPRVAEEEGVPADVLANYMAFRLSSEGQNWWATASTLQPAGERPWLVARDVALERIDFSRLNPADRELLSLALTAKED